MAGACTVDLSLTRSSQYTHVHTQTARMCTWTHTQTNCSPIRMHTHTHYTLHREKMTRFEVSSAGSPSRSMQSTLTATAPRGPNCSQQVDHYLSDYTATTQGSGCSRSHKKVPLLRAPSFVCRHFFVFFFHLPWQKLARHVYETLSELIFVW